jgi:glycosyltransferase involved in cell wall biosynthesis
LINASNLHAGGGIQVGASVIYELSKIIGKSINNEIHVILSTEVLNNLPVNTSFDSFSSLEEVNLYGFKHNDKRLFGYDIVFTIFGPLYIKTDAKYEVTGFAQAWIAYPDNLAYKNLNIKDKIKSRIIYKAKEYFFKQSNYLIVEAEHVKFALLEKGYDEKKISVVSNTISSIYDNRALWEHIQYSKKDRYTLGFIGRNYSHKNISRLKVVNEILHYKYNIDCEFLFTLTDVEMKENKFDILDNFKTVGSISVNQCPSFYEEIDALIFPSLLECFSVSPIEAMKMNCLVIASDLPFVRDVCKSSARYFDPLDNESIALAIYESINNDKENKRLIKNASKIVEQLPNSRDRADSYLKILTNLNNL